MMPIHPSISRSARLGVFLAAGLFLGGCEKLIETVSGGGGGAGSGGTSASQSANTPVRLNAFTQFQCTSNWTNRDGGLGLVAHSGSGTCKAAFPGGSGAYRIQLVAQTEFDGSPIYRISINGRVVASGSYPLSKGTLICDCPDWPRNCPDVNVSLDAGVHQIHTGDVIEFYGQEVYPCGKNGAYAKWHELVFTPVD